jgi:hypothetical protein
MEGFAMENYDYSELYDLFERSSGTTSVTWNFISLALAILMIVALWRIYGKAGEHGWASLIPYYRSYVLYKVSGKKKLFWWYLVCSIVCMVACVAFLGVLVAMVVAAFSRVPYSVYGYSDDELAMYGLVLLASILIMAVSAIAMFIFRIFQCIGLAKSFGLSGGYAAGLIFLPHIFYSIIAFSSNIGYHGPGSYYANAPYGFDPVTGQPIYNNYNQQYGQQGYNQPPFGQSGYNNPQYGQQGYGQPNNNGPQYSQPNYNQPKYSQPDYNQPQYGQPNNNGPQYGQQSYSRPGYEQPQDTQPQYGTYNPPSGSSSTESTPSDSQ